MYTLRRNILNKYVEKTFLRGVPGTPGKNVHITIVMEHPAKMSFLRFSMFLRNVDIFAGCSLQELTDVTSCASFDI